MCPLSGSVWGMANGYKSWIYMCVKSLLPALLNTRGLCQIEAFHRGVNEIFTLLDCYAAWIGR
jgi:hypothetical protein